MIPSGTDDELLRHAREAAGARDVRDSVRALTLHALLGHPLTAAHIGLVVRTVGRGIESSGVPPTATVRETHRGAWAGLEDAVDRALRAVELAAQGLAGCPAALAAGERERALAELAALERELDEEWTYPQSLPAALRTRLAAVSAALREAVPEPAPAGDGTGRALLSCVASGVLLGMLDGPGAPGRTG